MEAGGQGKAYDLCCLLCSYAGMSCQEPAQASVVHHLGSCSCARANLTLWSLHRQVSTGCVTSPAALVQMLLSSRGFAFLPSLGEGGVFSRSL